MRIGGSGYRTSLGTALLQLKKRKLESPKSVGQSAQVIGLVGFIPMMNMADFGSEAGTERSHGHAPPKWQFRWGMKERT
ncbi:hypothetical protein NDN08_007908 [Rhodosorus marinus]|uniref:Uncharacterized protein n=1 Tax=Rhodosorus marinus TaxID=101924 RepID=A0AAV8UYW7_9RHOD|nr:hypothetical protein NDN08_007908 [Rhodosorus marinus]